MNATFVCIELSTVSKTLSEICFIISTYSDAGSEFIKFTKNDADLELAATGFKAKFGFSQTIWCIDVTYIPIKHPNGNSDDYYCYKMKFSLNCQTVKLWKGNLRRKGKTHRRRSGEVSMMRGSLNQLTFHKLFLDKNVPEVLLVIQRTHCCYTSWRSVLVQKRIPR